MKVLLGTAGAASFCFEAARRLLVKVLDAIVKVRFVRVGMRVEEDYGMRL